MTIKKVRRGKDWAKRRHEYRERVVHPKKHKYGRLSRKAIVNSIYDYYPTDTEPEDFIDEK